MDHRGIAGTGTPAPDWQNYGTTPLPPVLDAALSCFVQKGYHGTTIREVAVHAGLSVPGVYHHYPSKHALLAAIAERAMADLLSRSLQAVADAGPGVEERFASLIRCLVLFHAHRRDQAFIAASEIRSLEPQARAGHVKARDRQQQLLTDIVSDGVATGTFTTEFPAEATRAVVTMCTSVAQWYRRDGGLSPEELADRYQVIARAALGG